MCHASATIFNLSPFLTETVTISDCMARGSITDKVCVERVLWVTIVGRDSEDGERRHRAVGDDELESLSLEDELLLESMDGHGEIDGKRGFSIVVWSTPFGPAGFVRDFIECLFVFGFVMTRG
jgi:hypothetical protein